MAAVRRIEAGRKFEENEEPVIPPAGIAAVESFDISDISNMESFESPDEKRDRSGGSINSHDAEPAKKIRVQGPLPPEPEAEGTIEEDYDFEKFMQMQKEPAGMPEKKDRKRCPK